MNINSYFFKRYIGTRYEFLLFISYEIDNKKLELNQLRKQDILFLLKKGNIILSEKNKINSNINKTAGPLFDENNIQNQWFWSKKSIDITDNNTHMSIDHIRNIIKYISPICCDASLYCNFNTENEKTYKLFTLSDAKIINKTNDKEIKHHLNNYFICKLPPGKKLTFSVNTEFNKPYVDDNEYDVDAQLEIKEIILFDIIDKTLLKQNPEQKFLYIDNDINKSTVTNNYSLTINNSYKFRRNHIIPILPNFVNDNVLYQIMNINEDNLINTFNRYNQENELSFINENTDNNIIIGFSIVGSSEYCPVYLFNAFNSLRRNISQYTFNDKDFVFDLITIIINSINDYVKTKTNKTL